MDKQELDEFNKEMDKAFDTTNTPLSQYADIEAVLEKTAIKDETKKLKIVGWIAASLSLIGIALNTYLIIWCWAVWIVSDFVWIYWSTKKKVWSQVVLWIIFIVANLYGWFIWATM